MTDLMRPPRFAVNVGERDLAFGQPSNCVVAIFEGEKHLFHWNRHRVFGKFCPRHRLVFRGVGISTSFNRFSFKNSTIVLPFFSEYSFLIISNTISMESN